MKKIVSLALVVLVLMSTVAFTTNAVREEDPCPFCRRVYPVEYIEASCTRGAHYRIYCTYCKRINIIENDETKPALGHVEAVEVVEATCLERGHDRHYCARCGENFYWTNIVEPYGHDYVQFERDPSWAKDECRFERYCKRCGNDERTTFSNGHTYPNEDNKCKQCNFDFEKDCGHLCHKDGFLGFIYKIVRIFWHMFGINKYCECGYLHP